MKDYDKLTSLVYEKRNLERALSHYTALEEVLMFYDEDEFEKLPLIRNKLYKVLAQVKAELDEVKKDLTPQEVAEAKMQYYKRYKHSFYL